MKNKLPKFSVAFLTIMLAASPLAAAALNDASTLKDSEATPDAPLAMTAPQFTKVIDDLPLMPGLKLMPENDVLFSEPHEGRIAETVATGTVDIDSVYDFYHQSLPHLGWKIVDGRTYQREQDLLRIDAHANGKVTTVRFSVKPAG